MKVAWKNEKNGELYEDRNEFLRSLAKDENGLPILDDNAREAFEELAYTFDWENEFVFNYVLDSGLVSARDFEEYYEITD